MRNSAEIVAAATKAETPSRGGDDAAPRSLTVSVPRWSVLIAGAVALATIAYTGVGAAGGASTLELPGQDLVTQTTRTALPQGWAFFTRSVDSEILLPFSLDDGFAAAATAPNASPQYAFGFNRQSRAQPAELPLILEGIGEHSWTPCESRERTVCLEEAVDTGLVTATNPLPNPSVCGRIGIAAEIPTPWQWRTAEDEHSTPTEVIALEIACTG